MSPQRDISIAYSRAGPNKAPPKAPEVQTTFLSKEEARALANAKAKADRGVAVFKSTDMLALPNNVVYEVGYAEEFLFGTGGQMLELSHSGLIFTAKGYHSTAPAVITLQYFGVSFGADVLMPRIDVDSLTLQWRNDPMVCCSPTALGPDRWNMGVKRVGTITGKVWNAFREWVPQFLERNPGYQMWDVWSHSERSVADRWVDGCKCDEFSEQALLELYRLGGKFASHPRGLLFKNYIPFLSAAAPTVVDMSDTDEAMAVVTHYAKLAKLGTTMGGAHGGGMSLPMMLRTLATALETWYVYERKRGVYLKVELSPPFICLDKLYQPLVLPWQPERIASVCEQSTAVIGEHNALSMLHGESHQLSLSLSPYLTCTHLPVSHDMHMCAPIPFALPLISSMSSPPCDPTLCHLHVLSSMRPHTVSLRLHE